MIERFRDLPAALPFRQQFGYRPGKQLPAKREYRPPIAVGEEALVADSRKARRQNMNQETPNELFRLNRHLR